MDIDRAPYSRFVANKLYADLPIENYANRLVSVLKDVMSQLLINLEENKMINSCLILPIETTLASM